jgi:hypothetical protein
LRPAAFAVDLDRIDTVWVERQVLPDCRFGGIRLSSAKYRSRKSSRERVFMMQPTKD